MKKPLIQVSVLVLLLLSCEPIKENNHLAEWQQQILKTEENFEKMIALQGIHDAFVAFADPNATLIRSGKLLEGSAAIDSFLKNENSKSLRWKADVVEVSKAGDLGFTYGKYRFIDKDSLGNQKKTIGTYSTVWKRQKDGHWKYILD